MSHSKLPSAVACLLVFAATAAVEAQSCSPVVVLVEVRDSMGRYVNPAALDSIVTTDPGKGPKRDFFDDHSPLPIPGDPKRYLWRSVSGCRLQVHRISFYQGARAMHLDFDMVVDASERDGPNVFLIEAPPLQPGTFRLRWDPLEPGGWREQPKRLEDDRWVPIPPP